MRAFLSLCLIALLNWPAFAQDDDAMEAQRCIWRCLYHSKGADDPAYPACINKLCNERTPGAWIFGEHPKLGLSAHVEIGEEAFGVGCKPDALEASTHVASLRMTPNLIVSPTREHGVSYVFLKPFRINGARVYKKADNDNIVEDLGGYCTLGLDNLSKSKTLILLQEELLSLEGIKNTYWMTVERDGQPIKIQTAKDLNKLAKGTAIPLTGASAAIAQLVDSCPVIEKQRDQDCNP